MLFEGEKISFISYKDSGFKLSEDEINKKYQEGELRIITESGRYPLQNIVDILKSNVRFDPDYQRRRVWSKVQKSRLIESFIMNVPVPPVFLYETDFSQYEVMDGLQRLSTLYEYYQDRFALEGLVIWPELNGMKYSQLPAKVRSGIDRRYISTIVILKETAKSPEEEQILKQFVFERLNTGGTKLTDQETRNALYDGPMNRLCGKIAKKCKELHKLWHIVPYEESDLIQDSFEMIEGENQQEKQNCLIRMEDIELVLRFFAYRQIEENPASKVKDILDSYLKEANGFSTSVLDQLECLYYDVLRFADELLGVNAFAMYTLRRNGKFAWGKEPSKLVYDPLLLALTRFVYEKSEREILVAKKDIVKKAMEKMFETNQKDFNGRNNNKSDVIRRKSIYEQLFVDVIQGRSNG